VSKIKLTSLCALAAMLIVCAGEVPAQQSVYELLRMQNSKMIPLQPAWMGPLIQSDSRLSQSARVSFSNSYTSAGTHTVNYGNWHTVNLLAGNRVQINLVAPPYIQNHSAAMKDGFGDASAEVKYRIASGNAAHGNFALTAMVAESWPTGSYQNGAPSAVYYPTIAAGRMWGRFDLQTTLGGALPTGKIGAQGRQICWNSTGQVLAGRSLWLDVEDNATFNYGGSFDSRTENFLTPAFFYVLRRKQWKPTHPLFVVGGGMQIATSAIHTSNHNLIPEMRILF
jgi:hypothetical protein